MWSMMGDSSFQADMSRQDLTELPESLFSRNTLQILDVHANKLTSLTSDVGTANPPLPFLFPSSTSMAALDHFGLRATLMPTVLPRAQSSSRT
jgi:hypothetical protein